MESLTEYVEKIPAVISKHDGTYAAQGQIPTVLEDDWKPDRLVVIEFPSPEAMRKRFWRTHKPRLSLHQSKAEALVERAVRLR